MLLSPSWRRAAIGRDVATRYRDTFFLFACFPCCLYCGLFLERHSKVRTLEQTMQDKVFPFSKEVYLYILRNSLCSLEGFLPGTEWLDWMHWAFDVWLGTHGWNGRVPTLGHLIVQKRLSDWWSSYWKVSKWLIFTYFKKESLYHLCFLKWCLKPTYSFILDE